MKVQCKKYAVLHDTTSTTVAETTRQHMTNSVIIAIDFSIHYIDYIHVQLKKWVITHIFIIDNVKEREPVTSAVRESFERKHINRSTTFASGVLGLLLSRVWYHLYVDVDDALLCLTWFRISAETRYQTPDAALELAVLGGVDERIDTAVGIDQHDTEIVDPIGMIDVVADKTEKVDDLIWRPADDESQADDHWRHGGVTRSSVCSRTFCRRHLNKSNDLAVISRWSKASYNNTATKHFHSCALIK